jgi:hypothetical protein
VITIDQPKKSLAGICRSRHETGTNDLVVAEIREIQNRWAYLNMPTYMILEEYFLLEACDKALEIGSPISMPSSRRVTFIFAPTRADAEQNF